MNALRTAVCVVYVAFFLATNWPILQLANRVEPHVGPFPLLVFWMLLWSIGIGVLHLLYGLLSVRDPGIPAREPVDTEEAGD